MEANDSAYGEKQEDFDFLVSLHSEVKSFKINNSIKILHQFQDNKNAKFYKSISELKKKDQKVHLSITASCALALAEFNSLWRETKQKAPFDDRKKKEKGAFRELKSYLKYIIRQIDNPPNESNIEALDEFTILNTLSFLKEIKVEMKPESKFIDKTVIKTIKALAQEFVKSRFAYFESPHPFIYYKFLMILNDWKEELKRNDYNLPIQLSKNIKTKHKYDKPLFDWFYDTIYNSAKYELYRQVSFFYAKENTLFDVKRLVYSLLIVSWQNRYNDTLLADKALKIIFKVQLETGLLPISHVINNDFIVTKEQNGEYKIKQSDRSASPLLLSFECFSDMLKNECIRSMMKKQRIYQEKLALAYKWANERLRKDHDGQPIGWYPEYESTHVPYSWVASHVLIFLKQYCSFLSEILNAQALKYFEARKISDLQFLDTYNIKEIIEIMTQDSKYSSALVFGPPGTGKTSMACYLARELGRKEAKDPNNFESWNFIEIIPGRFLASGKEQIIPKANEIFKRLSRVKKAVILFDEVDQLIKKRDSLKNNKKEDKGSIEETDRGWIVTALLPRWAELRKQENIRFILATNARLSDIDPAIMRIGRIDLILPMGAVSWQDRIKLLKSYIDKIDNDVLKKELNNRVLNNLSVDFPKDAINDSLLGCFLIRTDSAPIPKLILALEQLFDKEKTTSREYGEFEKEPLFKDLFSGASETFIANDPLLVNFKKRLNEYARYPNQNKTRLPNKENLAEVIKNNHFCE